MTRNPLSLRCILLLASILVAGTSGYFFANKATLCSHELWWLFAAAQSPRAIRAGLVGAILVGLFALANALRPARLSTALATRGETGLARAVVDRQDNPNANLAQTGDKSLLYSDSGRSFLMFWVQARSWILVHPRTWRTLLIGIDFWIGAMGLLYPLRPIAFHVRAL